MVKKKDRLVVVLLILAILFSLASIFINLSYSALNGENRNVLTDFTEGNNAGSVNLFVEREASEQFGGSNGG